LLLQNNLKPNLHLVELDRESVAYLKQKLPGNYALHQADVLKWEWEQLGNGNWGIIGNLPYNISSQIFFKVLEHKNRVTEVVAMVQREVGQRLAAGPGKKDNGILSILLQAYYDVEYLFTVPPEAFDPPPAVFSGVVQLRRNTRASLPVDEELFKKVVKMAFSSRRKMLRNNVKPLNLPDHYTKNLFFNKRAEQLGVDDFIQLVAEIEQIKKDS
jgi:16S rRNA (adenine1518-N6/adenine1519-N6)-dimethyltransferase